MNQAINVKQRLVAQRSFDDSLALSGWKRLAAFSPDRTAVVGFFVGLLLVLSFTAARLRFARWPLHPALFLVWSTLWQFAASFLAGWFLKTMISKYGGAPAYQRLKPMVFGVIAGSIAGGALLIAVGFIYYLATGEHPKIPDDFSVLPQ